MKLKAFMDYLKEYFSAKKLDIKSKTKFSYRIYTQNHLRKKQYILIKMEFLRHGSIQGLKKKINYKEREKKLLRLLENIEANMENLIVLFQGVGKDSCYASHILKYKYGMNPLTVTWPPTMYTDYGLENFKNWLKFGKHSNISAKRDPEIMRLPHFIGL